MARSSFGSAMLAGAVLAAAVALPITPAQAQSQVHRRSDDHPANNHRRPVRQIQPDIETRDSMAAYARMLRFGRCVARVGLPTAIRVLDRQPLSPAESHEIHIAFQRHTSCMPAGRTSAASLIRGVIAEGLYLTMAREAPVVELAAASPAYEAFMAGEIAWNGNLPFNDLATLYATNCLAAQQPALAHRILTSDHGSAEEAEAMDSILEQSTGCVRVAEQPRLQRTFLRAYLAQSLYRLSVFQVRAARANRRAGGA